MQHRRGVVEGGGPRPHRWQRRSGPLDDPKYGEKGRLALSPRTLVTALLVVVGLCAVYLFVIATAPPSTIARDSNALGGLRANRVNLDRLPHSSPNLVQELPDGSKIGYLRIPKIPPGERTGDDGKLHIIFSSGCNYFQHWQSEFLLASAHLVAQRGRITRIVSGCHDKAAETVQHRHQTFPAGMNDKLVPMEELNRSVNENFGLYVTPSFEGAVDFPWINKPSSIKYFMEHARPELDRLGETIIAILDPDFVFIKPLTQTGSPRSEVLVSRNVDKDVEIVEPIDIVRKGRPVAQRYGLEGGWVKPKYNLDEITGDPNTPAKKWTREMAAKYTSVGPPMLVHLHDLTDLSVLWEKYMRPVLSLGPDILADMWAYSIASAHLGLKHTILDHYMISVWGNRGEAYDWIDAWPSLSCRNPVEPPGHRSPIFLHLASNFKAPGEKGPWMFHKGHVPAKILDCDMPLIVEAPDDTWEVSRDRTRRQHAWVLCHTISKLNHVLLMYKQKFCPEGFEERKLIRLIQSKTLDVGCSERRDKWCFPLAQIERLPKGWRDELAS